MYKLFNKIFILSVISFVLLQNQTFALENRAADNYFAQYKSEYKANDFQNKTIRVLLSDKGSFEIKEIVVTSADEVFVTSNNQLVMNSSNPIKISVKDDYFLVQGQGVIKKVLVSEKLLISTNSAPITLQNISKASKTAAYSGNIEVGLSKSGKLKLINIIEIEDYLKGVVPNEMPVYFGLEALKAQAIAARGYAYRDLSYKTGDYDVCDTTGSQIYYGFNTNDKIANKAINDTMGQFALYDGKVILSLFSSTSGGHTESYENAFSQNGIDTKFPAEPIPYLKGVPDYNYRMDLSREKNAREFYTDTPKSFENASPKYRWEYTWSLEDLNNILAKNIIKFSSSKFVTPQIKERSEFGSVVNIDVPKRGVSGKAMYVRITTDKGVFLVAKEIFIRKVFEVNGQWLPSANIAFEKLANTKGEFIGYKVHGGGFGHGVGLSQFGALGMAKAGYKYDEILKHYYTGISIGSYPVECNLKDLQNCKATFYTDNNNAKLVLSYSHKPLDVNFKINGQEVLLSSGNFDKKSGQVDIAKLIKKGINTVELVGYDNSILNLPNSKINFYVELAGSNEK
ncbi:MAG: SpoIID/LytB domain-containing protein [Candidatus Gastranaerophilales bacterium]|nr:SpoIID/LytB domain-containing protein [Candidatus Gastranaerophilales bacterium]